jgi:hypothetical protein
MKRNAMQFRFSFGLHLDLHQSFKTQAQTNRMKCIAIPNCIRIAFIFSLVIKMQAKTIKTKCVAIPIGIRIAFRFAPVIKTQAKQIK